jgi:hypothetical protein
MHLTEFDSSRIQPPRDQELEGIAEEQAITCHHQLLQNKRPVYNSHSLDLLKNADA